MGIRDSVNQSTLSRANENRDWRIFADFGAYLINTISPLYLNEPKVVSGVENDIFAIDSSTISVSINLLNWAHGKYSRGAVKMHTVLNLKGNIPTFIHITDGRYHDVNALDEITFLKSAIYVMDKAYVDFKRLYKLHKSDSFFIVRAKTNLRFKAVKSRKVDKATGLRCDQLIRLQIPKSHKQYPEKIRRIKYHDREKEMTFVFLTNELSLEPLEIANVYRERWQIEVFFKWIKQNLELKKVWGHSQNTVKTQLWISISTYLIIAALKKQMRSHYTIYEITQILSISVFDRTLINQLFTENKINQKIKEQPNFFNNS